MQSNKEKRAALIARAEEVSKRNPYTKEDSSLFSSLMKLSDAMLVEGEPSNDEQRKEAEVEKDFELYLRTGELSYISAERRAFINENKLNVRTYQPETSQTAAVLIPNQWAGAYLDRLKSFVEIRAAGANVITTKVGGPWKYPFSDDTANSGEPAGVLPSITNVQVAATGSTTSVTVADLVSAQNIDAGYFDDGAVYMFSPGIERILKSMVATASGLRI